MFYGIGKPLPACPLKTKKGCGDAAAPLLEGLSLICADPVFVMRVADPPKLSAQPFDGHHEIVKSENNVPGKMFLFFPT